MKRDSGSLADGATPPSQWDQFAAYLSGECSAAESVEIERWAAASPANQARLEVLRRVWTRSATDLTDSGFGEENAWRRMAARIRHSAKDGSVAGPIVPRAAPALRVEPSGISLRAKRPRWSRIRPASLAAVAGILIAAALFRWPHRIDEPTRVAAAGEGREHVAQRGQRLSVLLLDGTRIVLAPETRLRVSNDFGRRSRDVHLTGTGYFDVAPDPERPFTVHAQGAVARVLGTGFVVRAYPGDSAVEVVVKKGSVSLAPVSAGSARQSHGMVLTRGQRGRVDRTGNSRMSVAADLRAEFAWTRGRLVFERTQFRHAVPQLERWYDVNIVIADSVLAGRRITAAFESESPQAVFSALAILLHARVVSRNDTLLFSPTGRARNTGTGRSR